MKENPTFKVLDFVPGLNVMLDESDHERFPLIFYSMKDFSNMIMNNRYSYFVYVLKGRIDIARSVNDTIHSQALLAGYYASIGNDGEMVQCFGNSEAIIIEVRYTNGYRSMFNVGGPIEPEGRLKYIDGCTDSLLIPPVKMGDPCLNHLHFPKAIKQTQHTHPSHRLGIVTKGQGVCISPFGDTNLNEGDIFVIKEWDGKSMHKGEDGKEYPGGQHSFYTYGREMDVIAFHPDSDFGPKDDEHPMINRTIVDGKSAKNMDEIRTK